MKPIIIITLSSFYLNNNVDKLLMWINYYNEGNHNSSVTTKVILLINAIRKKYT
jgi:hypothetical protein